MNTAHSSNAIYYSDVDRQTYKNSAPHLLHETVFALYMKTLSSALSLCPGLRVLDLGSGNGEITGLFIKQNAFVTAVDVSSFQLQKISETFANYPNPPVTVCSDALAFLKTSTDEWDIIVANSFLHHVPDYQSLIQVAARKLRFNGMLVTFQDPMRYDLLSWTTRFFSSFAYLMWRIRQKNILTGLWRKARRSLGVYKSDSVHDNTEYHVVRNGVDHLILRQVLAEMGMDTTMIYYFSTHSASFQALGEKLGLVNYFAIVSSKKSA